MPISEDDNTDIQLLRRFGHAQVAGAQSITATTTIHTPTSGRRVRLKWIALSSPAGQSGTEVTVKIGTDTHYVWAMSSPGAFMRTSIREGDVDEAFSVELNPSGPTVHVNY